MFYLSIFDFSFRSWGPTGEGSIVVVHLPCDSFEVFGCVISSCVWM